MPFNYPYTNYQELNLDWMLEQVKKAASVDERVTALENKEILTDQDVLALFAAIAPEFDATQAYPVRSFVWREDVLFYLNNGHTSGTIWSDTTHTEITVGEALTGIVGDQVSLFSLVNAINSALSDLNKQLNDKISNPPVLSIICNGTVYGNLWDDSTKAYGYYQNGTGELIEGGTSWLYSPTYIPVNPGDVIVYNNTRPLLCAYTETGDIIECLQPSWSGYTVPAGAKYLRFSIAASAVTGMCIFKDGTNQLEYTQPTQLYIPNLLVKKPVITVAANGDYTSITEALYDTYEEHPDVIVYVGTYDIVAEYKALFGNDIFDNMTYQTSGMKNFQWGIYIDNRKVTFCAGAKVVCDMSAYINDGSRRFSPFNLGENAIIEGLDCYAVNPYYVIHDDFGESTSVFKNEIRNCKLISPEPSQGNVIGGGCKMYSTKIVDNCYIDNGNNKPVAIRYHNTNVNGAVPFVIIKNTRVNSKIRLNYYGSQTTKMTAFVNNCKASAIEKADESSGSTDNVDLLEWCNDTGA